MPALLIIGLVIILGGGVLFAVWFEYLWQLVKALLPLALIGVGGVIAYFGWEEKKDRRGAFLDFSSPTEASRYQAEALAYQEKINGFQEDGTPETPPPPEGRGEDALEQGLSNEPAGTDPPAPQAAAAAAEPFTRLEIRDANPDGATGAEGPGQAGGAPGAPGAEAEAGPPEPAGTAGGGPDEPQLALDTDPGESRGEA